MGRWIEENGETSVGAAIGAHRRRWGKPFVAHMAIVVHMDIVAHMAIAAHMAIVAHMAVVVHIPLVCPAIVELTVRPAIAALIIFINNKISSKIIFLSNMIQLD